MKGLNIGEPHVVTRYFVSFLYSVNCPVIRTIVQRVVILVVLTTDLNILNQCDLLILPCFALCTVLKALSKYRVDSRDNIHNRVRE